MGESNRSSDSSLNKQRPLSNSFNEISRKSSVSRKEHELHYLKDYTSLTEYELTLLRKTAYTNLRNQFRELNNQLHNNTSNTNLSNATLGNSVNNVSGSNSSLNKNENKNSLLSPDTVNNTTSNTLLPQSKSSVGGSFSNLSYHSHNANVVPGKDFRESVIKNLENIGKVRNNKKWKIFSKKDKKREVFGIPLVTSLEYAFVYIDPSENCSNKKIPIVVYECINFLRKNGLDKEGIFRVNGSERRINNCLKVFNENAGYGFGYDFDGMNVFDVASLLKLYLRQLPEPLIPYCLYSSFLDVIKFIPDTSERIQAFQYLFMMLPTAHLVLLEILLQFLSEIIQHFEENHMNAHNLACIFAPNLLRSKESASTTNLLNLSSSEEYEVALQVVEFLLNHKSKFCISSPDVKPFQLCNNFGGIKDSNLNSNSLSLSLSDISSKKSNILLKFANITGSSKNINVDGNNSKDKNTSNLKNEIKVEEKTNTESSKANQDNSTESLNNLQPHNPVSLSATNMKSNNANNNNIHASSKSLSKINEVENDADINVKIYHPTVDTININESNSNNNESPSFSPVALNIKSKSNLENVRKHSEDSFYVVNNTCTLVSTSLNRLNYPLIKNNEFYELLTKDNDNITPAATTTNTNIKKVKEDCTTCSEKESISVASFNKSVSFDNSVPNDSPIVKKTELQDDGNGDQDYPSDVMNTAQKNRKNRDNCISFISPLSTPSKPIFCIPPPPSSPPLE